MKIRARLFLVLLAVSSALFAEEPAKKAEPPIAKVEDLAWLAGSWHGTMGGGVIEEVWLPAAAGRMLGMFRWTQGDRVVIYELLELAPNAVGHAVLRLRHFTPKLSALEEKDGALDFRLTSANPTEAQFSYEDDVKPARLVYKKDGENGLLVTLIRNREGTESRDEFRYQRQ